MRIAKSALPLTVALLAGCATAPEAPVSPPAPPLAAPVRSLLRVPEVKPPPPRGLGGSVTSGRLAARRAYEAGRVVPTAADFEQGTLVVPYCEGCRTTVFVRAGDPDDENGDGQRPAADTTVIFARRGDVVPTVVAPPAELWTVEGGCVDEALPTRQCYVRVVPKLAHVTGTLVMIGRNGPYNLELIASENDHTPIVRFVDPAEFANPSWERSRTQGGQGA